MTTLTKTAEIILKASFNFLKMSQEIEDLNSVGRVQDLLYGKTNLTGLSPGAGRGREEFDPNSAVAKKIFSVLDTHEYYGSARFDLLFGPGWAVKVTGTGTPAVHRDLQPLADRIASFLKIKKVKPPTEIISWKGIWQISSAQ